MPDHRAIGRRLWKISDVQQGVIAQNEFAKLVMMGSGGRCELAAPLTDEERRDYEIHVHGQYGSALAVQIKSALQLASLGSKSSYLRTFFIVRASRLVSDPVFWYFVAYLDPVLMRFGDPTFLIPSGKFHAHANPSKKGAFWHFNFEASMEPDSRDRWRPYRVNAVDLGKKVMTITSEIAKLRRASPDAGRILDIPGLVWIRKV